MMMMDWMELPSVVSYGNQFYFILVLYKSTMKLNPFISKLLTNKLALYVVFAVVFLNLFGYMMIGDVNFILFFILLCLIVHMFTKNMILVLAVSLAIVTVFKGGFVVKEGLANYKRRREGLENRGSGSNSMEEEDDVDRNEAGVVEALHQNDHIVTNSSAATSIHGAVPESFEVGSKNKTQMGSRIDYSSTIEQAYDNLDKILGNDGIQRLTGDTHKLMEQQMKLAEAMKTMGPLIENANSMLNTLNASGGGIEKLLKNSSGIQNMLGLGNK